MADPRLSRALRGPPGPVGPPGRRGPPGPGGTAATDVSDDIAKSAEDSIDRVRGLRGITLTGSDGVPPPIGGTWVYNEVDTETFKPQKPSHAGMFSVKDYGATGDGVTDDWAAFAATFTAAASSGKGAIVFFPEGVYRISATIDIDSAFVVKGCGSALFYPRSMIVADAGVTGFRVWGAEGPVSFGGGGSSFEDFLVCAAAKNTNTVTGTYTAESFTLSVDSAGDFENGQLIEVRGVGAQTTIAEIEAETTSGSPTVDLSSTGDGAPVVRPGQYLVIGTAYPTPTRVASVSGTTLTMASNAATTLAASPVKWCAPLFTRIVSGAGTTTWIIDAYHGVTSMACTVGHADAGFDILGSCSLTRVSVGDPIGAQYFIGPSFLIRGDHGNDPINNTNSCTISDCRSYGSKHAVYTVGADANACRIHVISLQSQDWSFADVSLLGNTYTSCHADGGLGYLSTAIPNATIFLGCYTEGGTINSIGPGSSVFGGTMGKFCGGKALVSGVMNYLSVGDVSYRTHQTVFDPTLAFLRVQSSDSVSLGLNFATTMAHTDPGVTGYFIWSHSSVARNHPIVINDTNAAHKPGTLWLGHDFWHGDGPLNNLSLTYGGRIATIINDVTGTEPGPLIRDPSSGPYDNDYPSILGANAARWKKGDWVRDPALLDGCVTRHVIEEGHRAPDWKPGTAYGQYGIVCPTVDNHNGRLYAILEVADGGTSDATEPDWTTAPDLDDTVVDNDVLWTNIGTAAYTQPVELDGYIVHEISGNETWTQTDRKFLCGSVEVTGTLAGNATLTLPKGRYKRWIWNNTTGGFSLLVKCSTGNTVTIATAKAAEVQCTGLEMRRRSGDVTP